MTKDFSLFVESRSNLIFLVTFYETIYLAINLLKIKIITLTYLNLVISNSQVQKSILTKRGPVDKLF